MATERNLLFRALRRLLLLTGRGLGSSQPLNNLHHKLGHRLFQLLPRLGFPRELRIPVSQLSQEMTIRSDDGGVSHKLLFYREYEPYEAELVRSAIRAGSVVYNIGANLGFYAVLAATAAGPEGLVIAIEPDDLNFRLLTENTRRFPNVHPIQAAVTNRTGAVVLGKSRANFGDHRIRAGSLITEARAESIVDGVTIDALIADGLPKPDVIIMDVQGAEGLVLEGFSNLYKLENCVIFTEFNAEAIARSGANPEHTAEALGAGGRTLFFIDETKKRCSPISIPEVLRTQGEINLYAAQNRG